jgi:hypothetical protein
MKPQYPDLKLGEEGIRLPDGARVRRLTTKAVIHRWFKNKYPPGMAIHGQQKARLWRRNRQLGLPWIERGIANTNKEE